MSIAGHATIEGTTRYRERLQRETVAANHFRLEQNLWLSSVGIGTYLGKPDAATDARYTETVARAVALGANVIDTAANYRFQRSERSIGAALTQLIEGDAAIVARDEIVVCTKGGYIPFDGDPPNGQEGVSRYIAKTFVETGVADFADIAAGSHCMTPKYLAHQIEQSLRNLQLSTVDVYYIHNPETQLGVVSRAEFETRLRAAFEQLERSVAEGKIKNYGVATWNGFRLAPSERSFHSLERMVELAREAAGGDRHHFRFVQLPFNLAMPEALVLANQTFQGAQISMLEAARALEVTVVASASILQGKVARDLAPEVREPLGSLASDALTAIQFVRSTPGITTALVGMSRLAHVEENLKLARIEPARPDQYQQLFSTGEA
ncbi:MAG TPA: aldo/keto reductase [Pyrinomonadaceae bacterium]|nr:aldo/keto reductase [Pyrinomonadaceae bacterium]